MPVKRYNTNTADLGFFHIWWERTRINDRVKYECQRVSDWENNFRNLFRPIASLKNDDSS